MSRWVRIHTSIFDHDVFSDEPFTEREAWLWLIAKAAWKETKHRVGNAMVVVPVGSLFVTLRELQTTWKWGSDYRVRAFLKLLQSEEMITVDANAGKTQINICNYSRYQNPERKESAERTHGQRKENALKTPVHQDTSSEDKSSSQCERDFFAEFWLAFPSREGSNPKKPASERFKRLVAKGHDPEAIIAAARQLANEHPTPTRFVPQAVTWLNQERFSDAAPVMSGDEFCSDDWPNTRFLLIRFRQEHGGSDPPRAVHGGKAGYLLPKEWVELSKQRQVANA